MQALFSVNIMVFEVNTDDLVLTSTLTYWPQNGIIWLFFLNFNFMFNTFLKFGGVFYLMQKCSEFVFQLVTPVTLTFDLWPPKPNQFIYA